LGAIHLQRRKIVRPEIRRIGVGDVLGKKALSLLMPIHPGTQHGEQR
jgi:hypothetical protein